MISRLDKFRGGLSRAYLLASQLFLGGLVFLVGVQVILRYATGKSIMGVEEWTGLMFTWLVFLMAAVLHRRKRHITITVLSDMFSVKGRTLADILIGFATIVFCIAVFTQLVNIWPYLSHATMIYEIPEIVFKMGLAVGIGTILLQEIVNIWAAARTLIRGE
jgi:TRAP-type transport system small permease protein